MAFNAWPFTNFADLNLDWILRRVKEAVTKSDTAYEIATNMDANIQSAIDAADSAIDAAGDAIEIAEYADKMSIVYPDQTGNAVNYVDYLEGDNTIYGAVEIYTDLISNHRVPFFMDRNQNVYYLSGYETNPNNPLEISRFKFSRYGGNGRENIAWVDRLGAITYTYADAQFASSMLIKFTRTANGVNCDKSFSQIMTAISNDIHIYAAEYDENNNLMYMSDSFKILEGSGIQSVVFAFPIISSNGHFIVPMAFINNANPNVAGIQSYDLGTGESGGGSGGDSGAVAIIITEDGQGNVSCNLTYAQIHDYIESETPLIAFLPGGQVSAAIIDESSYSRVRIYSTVFFNAPDGYVRGYTVTPSECYYMTGIRYATTSWVQSYVENITGGDGALVITLTQTNGVYTCDKTAQEILDNMYNLRLKYGLNEGVLINSYRVSGSPPTHLITFSTVDVGVSSDYYIEFELAVPYDGIGNVSVSVTNKLRTALPTVSVADDGKFLRVSGNQWVAATVPVAENNSFGGT